MSSRRGVKKPAKAKFEMPVDKRFDFSGMRNADPADMARYASIE